MKVRKILSFLLVSLGLLFAAEANAGFDVFISNVPVQQREVSGPPVGYVNCYMAPSGYFNGVWMNAHRICEYENSPYGAVWVAGFWQCASYNRHGYCGRWYWQRSHWVHRGGVEYGVVWHNHPDRPRYGHGPVYRNEPGPVYRTVPNGSNRPDGPHYDHRGYKGYDNGYDRQDQGWQH